MLTYWASARAGGEYARVVNDGIAGLVAASAGRLIGLGTIALQDVSGAVLELDRIIAELGLHGVEIGTRVEGAELDNPALLPFWEAAEALGAAVFVHPMDGGGGAIRRTGQPYDFGLGMLTDTAMAAGALVFGGVLERFPRLRIALAHGCGTFPWAYPRLRLGSRLSGETRPERLDDVVRLLWTDALVFDASHLALLTERFGEDHVMLGTDYPFVPGQLTDTQQVLRAAATLGEISDATAGAIRGANALAFVGIGQSS
jgi:aminocarboxymuconate-semialdehyde decarboxylase